MSRGPVRKRLMYYTGHRSSLRLHGDHEGVAMHVCSPEDERKRLALDVTASAEASLIRCRQVVKLYSTPAGDFPALKGIDLDVARGEFAAIIGKSGSGKSTLVNMMTGIDRLTSGEILIAGTLISSLSERRLARWRGCNVGVVFQFFQLMPTLTVVENVMLPMDFCHVYRRRERRERAMQLLDQVGMAAHARKLPSAVSGGEQQRVAIARALANDPPILMADEPTGSLDSKTAEVVFQLFLGLIEQGKTIVMATHDLELAQRARRMIWLSDGKIVDPQTGEAAIAEMEAPAAA